MGCCRFGRYRKMCRMKKLQNKKNYLYNGKTKNNTKGTKVK